MHRKAAKKSSERQTVTKSHTFNVTRALIRAAQLSQKSSLKSRWMEGREGHAEAGKRKNDTKHLPLVMLTSSHCTPGTNTV